MITPSQATSILSRLTRPMVLEQEGKPFGGGQYFISDDELSQLGVSDVKLDDHFNAGSELPYYFSEGKDCYRGHESGYVILKNRLSKYADAPHYAQQEARREETANMEKEQGRRG